MVLTLRPGAVVNFAAYTLCVPIVGATNMRHGTPPRSPLTAYSAEPNTPSEGRMRRLAELVHGTGAQRLAPDASAVR